MTESISVAEAAARVLDEERWGPCCYCEDNPRPHVHCSRGGFHLHVFVREIAPADPPSPRL